MIDIKHYELKLTKYIKKKKKGLLISLGFNRKLDSLRLTIYIFSIHMGDIPRFYRL